MLMSAMAASAELVREWRAVFGRAEESVDELRRVDGPPGQEQHLGHVAGHVEGQG